jgi:hypothetical protein
MQQCIRTVLIALVAIVALAAVSQADPIRIDFESHQTGEVIAGQEPQGAVNPGTSIPGITFSVINTGGGPHSLLVFDSANPSGDDLDLGTPNQSCGGPGIGIGGVAGSPGENCEALGKILIVAENLGDSNNDNLVDDPDDEAGGGVIDILFTDPIIFESCTFIDIEEHGGTVELWSDQSLVATEPIQSLGNNSAQTVSFAQYQEITQVIITMTGSGAVGEFLYDVVTPVESSTWGSVKSLYR